MSSPESAVATSATRDLCSIMLRDSAKIQESDVAYLNKKRRRDNQPPLEPIYTTADALASLLRRGGHGWVHVNLIPLNPTPGSKWTASRRADQVEFVRRLEAKGVAVTVRDTRGREIDGACGQLAATDRAETP